MSLEQSIADLTAQAGLLLDLPQTMAYTANTKIDALTARYNGIIASQSVTLWVDALLGLDTNAGSAASPLKTLQAAIDLAPRGGICTIYLQGNYYVDADVTISNKVVTIRNAGGTQPEITFAKYSYVANAVTYRAARQFAFSGLSHLFILDCRIVLPDTTGMAALTSDLSTLFKQSTHNVTVSLALHTCQIVIPAAIMSRLVGGGTTLLNLQLNNCTYPGEVTNPNGYLTQGQTNTAGVATNTLAWLRTNLATI